MENNDLKHWGQKAADWSAEYLDSLASRPVRPQTRPGEVLFLPAWAALEALHT